MLSKQDVLDLIKQYAQTPEGRTEIAKQHKGKFVAKYVSHDAKPKQTIKEMTQIGEEMKDILFAKISKVIPSFNKDDIIVGRLRETDSCQYAIDISFNEEALHRESLDPERYPEGVRNIVKLFINGYDARGAVYGVWKGHGDEEIWSLRHREPNDFMERAVNEFNLKHTDVARAATTEEYKTHI